MCSERNRKIMQIPGICKNRCWNDPADEKKGEQLLFPFHNNLILQVPCSAAGPMWCGKTVQSHACNSVKCPDKAQLLWKTKVSARTPCVAHSSIISRPNPFNFSNVFEGGLTLQAGLGCETQAEYFQEVPFHWKRHYSLNSSNSFPYGK